MSDMRSHFNNDGMDPDWTPQDARDNTIAALRAEVADKQRDIERLVDSLAREIRASDALREQVERLEKDAARYRWLRDVSHPEACVYYLASATSQARFSDPVHVDMEIDAALAQAQKEGMA